MSLSKQTSWIYCNILILNDAHYNKNGVVYRPGKSACLKIGKTYVGLSQRFEGHIGNYDVYASIPFLAYHVSDAEHIETELKKILKKYNISICCSSRVHCVIPEEFYFVNKKVINKIKKFASKNKETMELVDETKCPNDILLCDFVYDIYEHFELKEKLTIITKISDSLTMDQQRILSKCDYEDACEKFGLPKQVATYY